MLNRLYSDRRSASRPRHGRLPSLVQSLTFAFPHLRLEAFLFLPLGGDLFFALPEIDGEARQVGGAEGRCFGYHGAHDRNSQNIGLELEEEVVASRAAVDAEFFGLDAGILLHAFDDV